MADFSTDSVADLPVGIAYLLGNWATDRRATAVAGRLGDHRLISNMFDQWLRTEQPSGYAPLEYMHALVIEQNGLTKTLIPCT